jgi:EAL domain-containing protein (putative c-di-GMP-specific phosphodiesterase class I)
MRLLVIDDNHFARKVFGDALRSRGNTVDLAASAHEGLDRLRRDQYDVIVSDVTMPGMNGIDLLKGVREVDREVPVVLMTAGPTLQTATLAVEHGAYRYVDKSASIAVLEDVLRRAESDHAEARKRREALAAIQEAESRDRGLAQRFDAAVDHLWIAYQPIVAWSDRRVHGYEVLMRSGEGSMGRPTDLLEAAERLGRLSELGRVMRAKTADSLRALPADANLFVNLHPADLFDDTLYEDGPLARKAARVVLEITERATLEDIPSLPQRLVDLRQRGYRLAVDDLGAGYAGLSTLAHIEPDYVKLDMSLVRDIDGTPTKQKLVRSMTHLCEDLGMEVVAEGIETVAERDALRASGCELLQGYLFARPERRPPQVRWQ